MRLSRLKLHDEIETGCGIYPAAFFEVIPRGQRRGARRAASPLARRRPARRADPAARLVDRRRPRRQSVRHRRRACGWRTARAAYTALEHHFGEITGWSDELSMSARLVKASRRTAALADACSRAVPRRRALPASAAGHARPAGRHRTEILPTRQPEHAARPRPSATRRRRAAGRPRRRRRVAARPRRRRCSPTLGWPGCGEPCASSASTCAASTCGRTPTSTRRSSPSCWPGRRRTPTTGRCARARPRRAAGRRAGHRARPLAGERRRLLRARHARSSTSSPRRACASTCSGPQASPNYVISMRRVGDATCSRSPCC